MIYPTLNSLMEKVDSKYTLVVEVAKRARQLVDGNEPTIETQSDKLVSVAIQEVDAGRIAFRRTRDGIK